MQKQMMIIVAQLVDLARRLGLNLYCFGVKYGDSLFTGLVKCYKARPDPRVYVTPASTICTMDI